jgi:hypothetical protein
MVESLALMSSAAYPRVELCSKDKVTQESLIIYTLKGITESDCLWV